MRVAPVSRLFRPEKGWRDIERQQRLVRQPARQPVRGEPCNLQRIKRGQAAVGLKTGRGEGPGKRPGPGADSKRVPPAIGNRARRFRIQIDNEVLCDFEM